MELEQLTADEIASIIMAQVDPVELVMICEIDTEDIVNFLWHKIEPYIESKDDYFEELVEGLD